MANLYLLDNLEEFVLCLDAVDEWKCYLGAYDTKVAREEKGSMVLWEKDCRIVFYASEGTRINANESKCLVVQ